MSDFLKKLHSVKCLHCGGQSWFELKTRGSFIVLFGCNSLDCQNKGGFYAWVSNNYAEFELWLDKILEEQK